MQDTIGLKRIFDARHHSTARKVVVALLSIGALALPLAQAAQADPNNANAAVSQPAATPAPPPAVETEPPPAAEAAPPEVDDPAVEAEQPAPAATTVTGSDTPTDLDQAPLPLRDANIKLDLMPRLNTPTLTWLAVVLILALTLQTRPTWFSWHNLDGLALALMCVFMALRTDTGLVKLGGFERTAQWWAFIGLTITGGYFLLRGLKLVAIKRVPPFGANVNEGAMTVLVIAAALIAFQRIAEADYSAGSRDGFVGAIHVVETGELPYGDNDGHDARSPLVYGAHALAMQAPYGNEGDSRPLTLADRHRWETPGWWRYQELLPIRLVNAGLFVLMLLGVAGIGHRQHSVAMGQTLVALFCIFPGMLECLTRPEIMIPTVLMTWSLAFLRVPLVGPLLSALCMTLAGFGWVWAWLGLPVLIAHEIKRGAGSGFGAILGAVGGFVGALWLIASFTAPSLPRADGALAAAGQVPSYQATIEEGKVRVAATEPVAAEDHLTTPVWRLLLRGPELTLGDAIAASDLGYEVEPPAASSTPLDEIAAEGRAREVIQIGYRNLLAGAAPLERARMSLRTVLESTWKPSRTPPRGEFNAWHTWLGGHERAALIRRIVRIVAGIIGLLVALAVLRADRAAQHRVVGGLLAVMSAAMLAGTTGLASNLALLTPFLLATLAVRTDEEIAVVRRRAAGEPVAVATPRITVESGSKT